MKTTTSFPPADAAAAAEAGAVIKTRNQERRLHIFLIGAFLLAAYAYVWTIQPGYGPDEGRHFRYTVLLAEKLRLPERLPEGELDGAHTLHPPLYYALTVPIYLLFRPMGAASALWAIKAASPLIILAALALFAAALARLWPTCPPARLTALLAVGLLPELLLEAAVMNNDSLAILCAAALLLLIVRSLGAGPDLRLALLAGLLLALFANTKATALTLSPLWLIALVLRARRSPAPALLWARDFLVGYGVMLLVGGWWYLRNWSLYGSIVPLDFGEGDHLRPFNQRTLEPLLPVEVYTSGYVISYGGRAAWGLFQSFWVQIDWIPEPMRPAVFGTLLIATAAACAGWIRAAVWLRRRRKGDPAGAPAGLPVEAAILPVAGFLLVLAHTWFIATFLHLGFYQGGRYLMPAVFGAGVLLAGGWLMLAPPRLWRFLPSAVAAGLTLLNILCLHHLLTVLNPRYVQPFQ